MPVWLWAACTSDPPPDLTALLASTRDDAGIPALGLAVLSGEEPAVHVTGVRRAGADEPVTTEDPWHLASNTKAMTATLFALLAEEGTLQWETTLPQAFPELDGGVHPAMREVTIGQLLVHRGGVLALTHDTPADLREILLGPGDPRSQRAALTARVLAGPPATPPGTYRYSNAGYVVAAAAMERATDTSFEDLLKSRVFAPLGMTGCGFGPPARHRAGPWGHRLGRDGALVPVPPADPSADNPPAIGPTGTVHCPLRDWARFAAAHLAESSLLHDASWERLHTPAPGQDYAGGWFVTERGWWLAPVLTHAGTNTTFFSLARLDPERDQAWLAVTNAGTDEARQALERLVDSAVASPTR